MKGDFTRDTFDQAKHYNAVLSQQGRVDTDADRNEAQQIARHRHEATAHDVVGPAGVPKAGNGFDVAPAGNDLMIGAGHLYVDGILCENDANVLYTAQDPNDLAAILPPPAGAGLYVAYVDVWDRHVTALDDPTIREVALGGPDTATRIKTTWQVKLARIGAQNPNATCADAAATMIQLQQAATSTGTLTAEVLAPTVPANPPCTLPPTAGYRGLENQLYRVEIHKAAATAANARVKWSRDNGAVTMQVKKFNGTQATVDDAGRDSLTGLAANQWVEILGEGHDLGGGAGELVRIKEMDPATGVATFHSAPTPIPDAQKPRLRRWDQSNGTATADGVPVPATGLVLEHGITVKLGNGTFRVGDYWLIPARTAMNDEGGTIDWPETGGVAAPQSPRGIRHHLLPLAVLNFDGAVFTRPAQWDCRVRFPSLTTIAATDVSFDDAACASGAKTVQEAIDHLCGRHDDCCGEVIRPGAGWVQDLLAKLAGKSHAHVCLQPGTYPVTAALTIANKGKLRISGTGSATRIVAQGLETAIRFENCDDIHIEHLAVETGASGSGRGTPLHHLAGSLTFIACKRVAADGLTLTCAPGAHRASSCFTVRNAPKGGAADPRTGAVSLRHSVFHIGQHQIGALLVNVARVRVSDCEFQLSGAPAKPFSALVADAAFRGRFRRVLISPHPPGTNWPATATVALQGHSVTFRTEKTLAPGWNALVAAHPPTGPIRSAGDLTIYLERLAHRVLLESAVRNRVPAFRNWYEAIEQSSVAVASQGIVIAGEYARDVRIVDNTIDDVLEGIHAGFSHRGGFDEDAVGTLTIGGNRITTTLPVGPVSQHFGVFVGNCDSLVVENNYMAVKHVGPGGRRHVEGLRVHGNLGQRMIVRHNHLVNYGVGISIVPNRNVTGQPQWLVADNIASGAQGTVVVGPVGKVRLDHNYP